MVSRVYFSFRFLADSNITGVTFSELESEVVKLLRELFKRDPVSGKMQLKGQARFLISRSLTLLSGPPRVAGVI